MVRAGRWLTFTKNNKKETSFLVPVTYDICYLWLPECITQNKNISIQSDPLSCHILHYG